VVLQVEPGEARSTARRNHVLAMLIDVVEVAPGFGEGERGFDRPLTVRVQIPAICAFPSRDQALGSGLRGIETRRHDQLELRVVSSAPPLGEM
jgi:hypothetical protein